MRWKNWDKALLEKKSYEHQIDGIVYCNVDIRQYWKPKEDLAPTKMGIHLRPKEYHGLKDLLPEIGQPLPELSACFLQSDHMNQFGALQCSECYPNDYNW